MKWFQRFFAEHPGEQLESILFESSDHRAEYYSYSIPGKMLNDLGFAFFSPGRNYEIKQFEGEDLVTASAFESHEPPDEDGFGAEDNYDWWFLDENMQLIPGVESVNATMWRRTGPFSPMSETGSQDFETEKRRRLENVLLTEYEQVRLEI
ncbi:MAG: hypothetical protein ACLRWH_05330 [Emergencia sp.]